jgi:hypothetical protein
MNGTIFPSGGQANTVSPRLTAALEYAEQGLRIFPCRPGGKVPCFSGYFEQATTDPAIIRGWFETFGDVNIAFCPDDNGMGVFDLDNKNGKTGQANFYSLPGEKPMTTTVLSPTGGVHLWYRGRLRMSSGEIASGVDTRGIRSYVLLPSSVTEDGEYSWLISPEPGKLLEPTPMEPWMIEWGKPRERTRMEAREDLELDQPWNVEAVSDMLQRYAAKGDVAVEGHGGDARTYKLAAEVMDYGISPQRTVELIDELWNPHCMPSWSDSELEAIVEHTAKYRANEIGCRAYPDPAVLLEGIIQHAAPSSVTIGTVGADMGEPVDIFGGRLTPEPVLRRGMLPPVIANFAFDRATCLGVDPAMIAIPALVACASGLHDGIKLQPKARDTEWTESARLWAAMMAPPGDKKTPALNAALQPLKKLEQDQRREDDRKLAEYKTALEQYKLLVKNSPTPPPDPEKPIMRRLLVGDATMEKLAEVLAENECGVLMVFDELASLFGGFDAYRSNGAHKDRTAALELWNGDYKAVDRVKGSIAVPNWGASIIGGIQPDKLREMAARSKWPTTGCCNGS